MEGSRFIESSRHACAMFVCVGHACGSGAASIFSTGEWVAPVHVGVVEVLDQELLNVGTFQNVVTATVSRGSGCCYHRY